MGYGGGSVATGLQSPEHAHTEWFENWENVTDPFEGVYSPAFFDPIDLNISKRRTAQCIG